MKLGESHQRSAQPESNGPSKAAGAPLRYRSILQYVQPVEDKRLEGVALFFDLVPVALLAIALVSLAFVSFRDAGSTLVGLGVFLLYMSGTVYQSTWSAYPYGLTMPAAVVQPQLPRSVLTWAGTGVAALALGGLLTLLHPAPKPVAVTTPSVRAVTAQHVAIDLPCRAIRLLIVAADASLRGFTATSQCANASGSERRQTIPATSVGLGVRVLELRFAGSPSDIHVELRGMPRAAVFETALAENLVRQPFENTESLVWDVKDANDLAFAYLAPWLAPARAAFPGPIDFLLNLRQLGWGWGLAAALAAFVSFVFRDRIVKGIGDALLALFGRKRAAS